MEVNLTLVYLSKSYKSGYNVYCKTPSMKFKVAASNVVTQCKSIVSQNFIIACSSLYTFGVINENNRRGVYDPER